MSLTTDPNNPCLRKIETEGPFKGQQKCYLVLSAEERQKGFVRPVRTKYVHVACGAVTVMGLALSETYARDPKFYSGTFCCHCGDHFGLTAPDGKPAFLWEPDGDPVGSTVEEAEAFFAERDRREAVKHLGAGI